MTVKELLDAIKDEEAGLNFYYEEDGTNHAIWLSDYRECHERFSHLDDLKVKGVTFEDKDIYLIV